MSDNLKTWLPNLVGLVLFVALTATASCERLKGAEAPARALLAQGETVCALVGQGDEERREVCGSAVEVARLLVALEDARTGAAAPSASASAPPAVTPACAAGGGDGGP